MKKLIALILLLALPAFAQPLITVRQLVPVSNYLNSLSVRVTEVSNRTWLADSINTNVVNVASNRSWLADAFFTNQLFGVVGGDMFSIVSGLAITNMIMAQSNRTWTAESYFTNWTAAISNRIDTRQFGSQLLSNLVSNPVFDWTNRFSAGANITLTTNAGGSVSIAGSAAGLITSVDPATFGVASGVLRFVDGGQTTNLTNYASTTLPLLNTNRLMTITSAGQLVNAIGTPDGLKFLRDDGVLAVPPPFTNNVPVIFVTNLLAQYISGDIFTIGILLPTNTVLIAITNTAISQGTNFAVDFMHAEEWIDVTNTVKFVHATNQWTAATNAYLSVTLQNFSGADQRLLIPADWREPAYGFPSHITNGTAIYLTLKSVGLGQTNILVSSPFSVHSGEGTSPATDATQFQTNGAGVLGIRNAAIVSNLVVYTAASGLGLTIRSDSIAPTIWFDAANTTDTHVIRYGFPGTTGWQYQHQQNFLYLSGVPAGVVYSVHRTAAGQPDFGMALGKSTALVPIAKLELVGTNANNNYFVVDTNKFVIRTDGKTGIGTATPTSPLQVVGLPVYANNAAAVAGGLTTGAFYRTGTDPDQICAVH